ncbi:hypothetical protein EV356DRAFT_538147 [Viridothelium virens]|uniref:Uncharacterized protein n=1 Tax=Viridothelium virens TaxID=1048519 RepID=A0A6A6GRQ1_VIRVR|nr:hypothetical protein EV356DRAFT_538147 [Viridothelium virens]
MINKSITDFFNQSKPFPSRPSSSKSATIRPTTPKQITSSLTPNSLGLKDIDNCELEIADKESDSISFRPGTSKSYPTFPSRSSQYHEHFSTQQAETISREGNQALAVLRASNSAPASPKPLSQGSSESSVQGSIPVLSTRTEESLDPSRSSCTLAASKKGRSHRARVSSGRVGKLHHDLQKLRDGQYVSDEPSIRRTLSGPEFQSLLEKIKNDPALEEYFNDKVRYEYSHQRKEFVVRMQTALHSTLERQMEQRFIIWLAELKKGPQLFADFARNINSTGSQILTIPVVGNVDACAGDLSFEYEGCDYPSLIIEVSASQSLKKVEEKAGMYIRQTRGGIRTVIHLDVNDIYKNAANSARFSIWRAKFPVPGSGTDVDVIESEKCKVFRKQDKQPGTADIELDLLDLMCPSAINPDLYNATDVPKLVIRSQELCDMLESALKAWENQKRRKQRALQQAQELLRQQKNLTEVGSRPLAGGQQGPLPEDVTRVENSSTAAESKRKAHRGRSIVKAAQEALRAVRSSARIRNMPNKPSYKE